MTQKVLIAIVLLLMMALIYQCNETKKCQEALKTGGTQDDPKPNHADSCKPSISGICADSLSDLDHNISCTDAETMIEKFWANKALLEDQCPAYDSLLNMNFGETFSRDALFELLQRPNIAGVKVTYGVDATNHLKLILLGVKGDCSIDLDKILEKGMPTSDTLKLACPTNN